MSPRTRALIDDALTAYRVYLSARDLIQTGDDDLTTQQVIALAAWALPTVRHAAQAVDISPRGLSAKAALVLYALEHLEHVIDTQEVY